MKKRMFRFYFICAALLAGLVCRIGYLSFVSGVDLSAAATGSQTIKIITDSGRGDLFDRNHIPITRNPATLGILLGEEQAPSFGAETKKMTQVGTSVPSIQAFQIYSPMEQIKKPGEGDRLTLVENNLRYRTDPLLAHLVGYTDKDGKGIMGIEKDRDSVLRSGQTPFIRLTTDAPRKRFLTEPPIYSEDGRKNGLILTIDAVLQQKVEEILKDYNGAVVVSKVNGELLAYASSPAFRQDEVTKYVNSSSRELVSKVTTAYEPGSVFKLVMAAAALENLEDAETMQFQCSGSIQAGESVIACHNKNGHGTQNLAQALANSCNPAFIELGSRLGINTILDMAYKMGFGGEKTAYTGQTVSEGNLPQKDVYFPADIANTSIGQGEVLITPLQLSGVLNVIASGGLKMPLNSIQGVCDERGNLLRSEMRTGAERVLKKSTAKRLVEMMKNTAENGTASNGKLPLKGGSACKTGTAQTGWTTREGEVMMHAWFAGIFPADRPEYTVSVFVENGRQGNTVAGKVFHEVAEEMIRLYEIE